MEYWTPTIGAWACQKTWELRCGGGVDGAKHRAGRDESTQVAYTPLNDYYGSCGWPASTLETGSSRPRLEPLLNRGGRGGAAVAPSTMLSWPLLLKALLARPSPADKGSSPL
jgi:hypothetical protein